MADERNNPTSERATENEARRERTNPAGDGAGAPEAPRPAVSDRGEGYPEVDSLSFDPEGRDWMTLTRRWIEQNPGLAVLGAAAAGVLLGRVIAAAIPEPEPQTFKDKVEVRARELAKHGKEAASDAGDVAGKQLAIAAEALGEASKAIGAGAKRGYTEAREFGDFLAENVGKVIAERASKWFDSR